MSPSATHLIAAAFFVPVCVAALPAQETAPDVKAAVFPSEHVLGMVHLEILSISNFGYTWQKSSLSHFISWRAEKYFGSPHIRLIHFLFPVQSLCLEQSSMELESSVKIIMD